MTQLKVIGGTIGTAVSAIGAGLSVTEIQAIVSIVATIIGLAITIFSAVIVPLIKKIKEAKADGKITIEELEDIANDLEKNIKDIKESNNDHSK